MISSWTFFWLIGGKVIGSQHHQLSGSNWSGVYVVVGNIQLTSSIWQGFQYLQHSSKDIAKNITFRPPGVTQDPWFCLMAIIILTCLAVLLCFGIFSLLWLHSFFGTWRRFRRLEFSYKQEASRGQGGVCPRKAAQGLVWLEDFFCPESKQTLLRSFSYMKQCLPCII